MQKINSIDEFIAQSGDWQEALTLLRQLALESELEESIKWGIPVYVLGRKNVLGISAFKSYAGIWFYQGALLKDDLKKLLNAQEGITKALRQWRFQSVEEIRADADLIKAYIEEAIANQKAGKEIKPKSKGPLVIPAELAAALEADAPLTKAFEGLNLSKQRDYAEYIETARQAVTRQKRLEKIIPMILEGIGLNDKYGGS